MDSQNPFKWRHFKGEIILLNVRWYLSYPLSYRNLEEMMLERGLEVDHTTICRWVLAYPPAIKKLKEEKLGSHETELRRVKYLNNRIEQDHRGVKRITKASLGYQSFHTAWRTIRGIEAMHMIRKGQVKNVSKGDSISQKEFIESLFEIAA